jgi:dihydrofolate synthase/folylpolyglutamate synthase
VDYGQTLEWLSGRGRFRIKPGLDRTESLLQALGAPHLGRRGVLVGGTNGKGSTCAITVAGLVEAGSRVGSMPSPHLQSYTERIRVDGVPVTEEVFASLISQIRTLVDHLDVDDGPTEFEIIAAAAITHFHRSGVDLVVAEVGMGGRLDATNVLDLGTKVIVNVALDHQEFLGDTLAEIADHKAGIIRRGDDVVVGGLAPEADRVVAAQADRVGARSFARLADLRAIYDQDGQSLSLTTVYGQRRGISVPAHFGAHIEDVVLAIAATDLLCASSEVKALNDRQWESALRGAVWPGRMEVLADLVMGERCLARFIMDGAHNAHAMERVVPAIRRLVGSDAVLVLGAMRDKVTSDLVALLPADWRTVVTTIDSPRSATPESLVAVLQDGRELYVAADVEAALNTAASLAGDRGNVVVMGSLYLIGAVRDYLHLAVA